MAKDAQAEMITIGLKDEGGMVDEASGNEVPNGALKEEVRDDQPAMLSPGEFVIPAYAVRYFGVEQFVKMLRAAKQGMEQLSDMGLTGEPNSDDSSLETAMLPTDVDEDISQFQVGGFQPGAVTQEALPPQATQQVFPTSPVVAAATAPSPVTAIAPPTAPVRPAAQQNVTYPQYVYSPQGGGGYGVAEYVGPNGQAIFVTTIAGKPISQIPEGFKTRAQYNKDLETQKQLPTTTPPSELQRKPEDMDPGDVTDPGFTIEPEGDKSFESFGDMAKSVFGAAKGLGAFAASMRPTNIIATMATAGVLTALGKTEEEIKAILPNKPITIKKALQLLAEDDAKTKAQIETQQAFQAIQTAESEAAAAEGGKAIDAAQARANVIANDPTSTTSEIEAAQDEVIDAAQEAAGREGITIDAGNQGSGQGIPGSYTPPDASGMGSEPGGVEYSAPSDAPSDMDAANVSMPNKGGFIGMAEGGLIKVGDKTYGPEDFGFANKGTFVNKKKPRKRKPRGKGLASSM